MFTTPGALPQLVVERIVDAPGPVLFEVMTSEAGMKAWVPLCRSAGWRHPPGADGPGLGSVRHFRLAAGIRAAERIVIWDSDRQINYRFDQTTLPFDKLTRNYEGAMVIESIGLHRSRLTWAANFDMPGALRLWKVPVRTGLRGLLGLMADNLVRVAECRAAATKNTHPPSA